MTIQLPDMLGQEYSDESLTNIIREIQAQGLLPNEISFILSQDEDTVIRHLLSAIANRFLGLNQEATQQLEALIANNNIHAMYLRAEMYRDGRGTPNNQPDYPRAIELLDIAVAKGSSQAMVMRADMYRNAQCARHTH